MRASPQMSSHAVRATATRESMSSTQSTGTSWMRRPSRRAATITSVSKNQAWSSTSGSTTSAASRRMALKPHCASVQAFPSAVRTRRL